MIYYNDKLFIVCFLEEVLKVMECWKCKIGFIRRIKIILFDIVLFYEECWMYFDFKDCFKWLLSVLIIVKYYCVRKFCVVDRFLYFNVFFVEVLFLIIDKLLILYVKILKEEFGYCVSW